MAKINFYLFTILVAINQHIHEQCSNSKILLFEIFPLHKEVANKALLKYEQFNNIIANFNKFYSFFTYLDNKKTFLKDDGSIDETVPADFLHPNAKGYKNLG